jgi:hypothetical protein
MNLYTVLNKSLDEPLTELECQVLTALGFANCTATPLDPWLTDLVRLMADVEVRIGYLVKLSSGFPEIVEVVSGFIWGNLMDRYHHQLGTKPKGGTSQTC